jgi:hypothetical protein
MLFRLVHCPPIETSLIDSLLRHILEDHALLLVLLK